MGRKILICLMTALLMLSLVTTVSAETVDPLKTGTVSVTLTEQTDKTPIVGAELSIYYIAFVDLNAEGQLSYWFTSTFEASGYAIDDPDLAKKLEGYLVMNPVPAITAYTDEQGTAVFQDLPAGLYLVRQTVSVAGYAPCTPFLVTVPMTDADGYVYQVNATPKTEVAKQTDITIRKVWNTDASSKMPGSVTVQLLRGEEVVQTVVLHEGNGWQMTLTGLPESDDYSIREVNVPAGFTATYHRSGYLFTVINTPSLLQTGQLIWPIPVLAVSGMLLMMLGFVLLQKKRDAHA